MRIRTYVLVTVLSVALLSTGCSSDDNSDKPQNKPSKQAAADAKEPDCGQDSDLSQAEWMEHCADQAEEPQDASLKAGQAYKWPDGLTATVTKAAPFETSGYEPGEQPFQLHIRFENKGPQPIDLGEFSTFVEGATNGGEAAFTSFDDDAEEITGHVAPGVTTTKTEDLVIEKKYGTKLIVTLQYGEPDTLDSEFPEATVTIK